MSEEITQWCTSNGLGDIGEGLQNYIEQLEDLTAAEDSDIADIVKGLQLPMKGKLKFKKAVKALQAQAAGDGDNKDKGEKKVASVEPGMCWQAKESKENGSDEKEFEGFELRPQMPIESGVYVIPTVKKEDINGPWKTIMVIGETGSGKSTTLNSMVNYLWDVSLEDHYRFVLIPPPKKPITQGDSVTVNVTSYHFSPPKLDYGLTVVDTPGFGDTGGMDTDAEIVKKIEKAFQQDLDTIDAVFFVLKASQSRLTAMQRYVFNSMLRVFGKDITSNLFLLITFCDGDLPPVYSSVEKYELPYQHAFELNNSAFFTGFKGSQVKPLDLQNNVLKLLPKKELAQWLQNKPAGTQMRKVTKHFWEMGIDAMENLFEVLNNTSAKSLSLSRQVLDLRNHLQLRIKSLHERITQGLNMIGNIRQLIDTIKAHAKDVNSSKGFEIQVTESRLVEKASKNNVTTCSNCKYTCHSNCVYDNSAQKKKCCAMDAGGHCGVCPKKCWWNCHTNEHYIMVTETYTKTVTKEGLKQKFDESTEGMTNSERIIISQTEDIITLQGEVAQNIEEVRNCIETLGDIALKPCVMEEDAYYELMIQSEEEQREPNYQHRIKAIKKLREQAKQVRMLQKSTKGQEAGKLFQSQLDQLQQDLMEIKEIQGEAPEAASQVLGRVSDRIEKTQATFRSSKQKSNEQSKKTMVQTVFSAVKNAFA